MSNVKMSRSSGVVFAQDDYLHHLSPPGNNGAQLGIRDEYKAYLYRSGFPNAFEESAEGSVFPVAAGKKDVFDHRKYERGKVQKGIERAG